MDALLTFGDAHDVKWMSRKGEEEAKTPFPSFSVSSEATKELVDPELGLTFSSGKFDTRTVIKATAGYNSLWTDEESPVIYSPTKNGSLKTESEESKDVSFTQPESTGTDKNLPGPSRTTETGQKTAEASFGNFETLLQEIENIGRSEELGLKVFCNVPFEESNDAMYISFGEKETQDQPWPKHKHAGNLPLIIVQKNSIILLDAFQKHIACAEQLRKLKAAKKILSKLLKTIFKCDNPGRSILKALYFSEDDFFRRKSDSVDSEHPLSRMEECFGSQAVKFEDSDDSDDSEDSEDSEVSDDSKDSDDSEDSEDLITFGEKAEYDKVTLLIGNW
jgi:hypothetical protein